MQDHTPFKEDWILSTVLHRTVSKYPNSIDVKANDKKSSDWSTIVYAESDILLTIRTICSEERHPSTSDDAYPVKNGRNALTPRRWTYVLRD